MVTIHPNPGHDVKRGRTRRRKTKEGEKRLKKESLNGKTKDERTEESDRWDQR